MYTYIYTHTYTYIQSGKEVSALRAKTNARVQQAQ